MRADRRIGGGAALVALAVLVLAACAAGVARDRDGIVVDNRSGSAVTVEMGEPILDRTSRDPAGTGDHPSAVVEPSPGPVTVDAGSTALIPTASCVWREARVLVDGDAVAEFGGPVCAGEVLRVPADGSPYLESVHG